MNFTQQGRLKSLAAGAISGLLAGAVYALAIFLGGVAFILDGRFILTPSFYCIWSELRYPVSFLYNTFLDIHPFPPHTV